MVKTGAKSITVRMALDINQKLDDYCSATRFSKSMLVNAALDYFVDLNDDKKFEVIKDYVVLSEK